MSEQTTIINTIDYRTLPVGLRMAGRQGAVAQIKAGEKVSKVAENFGTTIVSVKAWVKLDAQGELGEVHKRGRKPKAQ
jgi:hypothetical protein